MTFADNGVDYFKATPGGLNHPIVSCFEEDSEGNLWIGTEGGGINRWDRRDGRFVYYTQESRCGLTSNMIKKLWHDGNDRLLVSAFNGGMRVFDERQGRFSDLYMNHPASGQPLSVYDFAKEGDRGIWLTDPDAELMYKDASTGRVETVRLTDAQGNAVRIHIETLFHDERGDLWLVGHDGAYVVDPATRRILKRHYIAEAPYSVNNLCSYCVTSDSDIWFGTRGGGVNLLRRNGSYVNFRDRNGEGLEGKTVFGILEDTPSKDVWFSTNDGLYYYDHTDGVIRKSQIDIPNRCGAYYVRACYKTSKGEMLFGGTDGFILFTPGKIKYNDQKPKVYFTDLLINSRPAVPGAKNSPLEKAISTLSYRGGEGDVIELSHRESNFEIRFSANSYLNAEKNQYAYRLLGHSERWSLLPQGQKAVQFFNLPAGNYVFEVKAANNDGLWGDEVSALGFRVHPSPFLSRWAYLVYAALLSAVAYFIWRYFTNKKIFEQRLELERIKEQNMKQLTQARINFFTNISHDLKTPLTLVVDPLKQLKEHLPANAPGNAYVHLIEKNVGRIQRMISQLLQFREIESQKITLNRQPGDLIRFIDSIFSLFEFYANKKGIETGFNSQYESFYTKFDHDVIEKIFTNLFSNAIKYASENGYVGVRIYPARQDQRPESAPPAAGTEYIAFTVTNTGAEIPDDKKEAIFESFNHLSDRRPQFESSSGLGLAIVKELVGNLNGTITLRSGNSKVAFTVVLPFTLNAEKTDRIVRIHGLRNRQPADRIRRHGSQRPARPQGVQHRGHRGRPQPAELPRTTAVETLQRIHRGKRQRRHRQSGENLPPDRHHRPDDARSRRLRGMPLAAFEHQDQPYPGDHAFGSGQKHRKQDQGTGMRSQRVHRQALRYGFPAQTGCQPHPQPAGTQGALQQEVHRRTVEDHHFVDGRGTAEKGDELHRTEHGQQRLQRGFVRVGHVDRTHAPLPEDQRHHGHPAETVGPAAPGVGPDHLRDLGPDGIRQSQIFQHLFQTAFRTDPIRI